MAPILSKKDTEPLRKYTSVQKWLKGKSKRTQYRYLRILARLTMQVEETPASLVRLVKRQDPNVLKELIESHPISSQSALRSFFKTNGCSWAVREAAE